MTRRGPDVQKTDPEAFLQKTAGVWMQPLCIARQEFLSYLDIQRQLSPHTLRAYQNDSLDFLSWLMKSHPEESPHKATLKDLPSQYMAFLARQSLSRSSLARKSSSLRSFLKYVMKEEFFPLTTFNLRFHQPRLPQHLPRFLSKATIDDLLAFIPTQKTSSYLMHRNQLMIQLLFSSGMRVSELVGLNLQSLNREEAELRVMGKGNRERLAFASRDFWEHLTAWLPLRQALVDSSLKKGSAPQALFLNSKGQRLSDRSVHRILADLGRAYGLAEVLHPHMFRHSFATYLLDSGVELRLVQELLGHVSIRSTQIYTHISTEKLRQAYLKAHPRAR